MNHLQRFIGLVATVTFFTWGIQGNAVEWFDDFSDGNADAPPVQWTPIFAGDYDASTGDYILTGTDNEFDDESLGAIVGDTPFLDTSIRTQAVVGISTLPDPDNNADFDASSLVTGSDFLIWQKGAGGTGTQPEGDANFDSLIDGSDLNVWKDQFGGPPNLFGGNVGVVARFNPDNGKGYVLVIDSGNQWNLLVLDGGEVVVKLNEGNDDVPIDPDTGERINAQTDIMIQLDVTGEGVNTLLDVWFWKPNQPMPTDPFFSSLDPDGEQFPVGPGVAGIIYNEDENGSPGIFRFVQASDTHLGNPPAISAVPEPASGALAVLTLLALGLGVRAKRGN